MIGLGDGSVCSKTRFGTPKANINKLTVTKNKTQSFTLLLSGLCLLSILAALDALSLDNFPGFLQQAYAIGGTIDASTCESIFGGSVIYSGRCDIDNLTIGSGETLVISDNYRVAVHGTLAIDPGGTVNNNGGIIDILAGGNVNVLSGGTLNLDTSLAAGVYVESGGAFSSAGSASSSGDAGSVVNGFVVYSGGTLNIVGGTLSVSDDSDFSIQGGTLNISDGTLIVTNGALISSLSTSTINVNSGGMLSVPSTGIWDSSAGTIVNINSGGIYSFSGTTRFSGTGGNFNVNFGGKFDVSGGTLLVALVGSSFTVNPGGTLDVSDGTFRFNACCEPGFRSAGTTNVNSDGTFILGGGVGANSRANLTGIVNVNSGGIFQPNSVNVRIGGITNVNSGGTLHISANHPTITSEGTVFVNSGKIVVSGGGLNVSGKIYNPPGGNMTISGSITDVNVNYGGAIVSSGGSLNLISTSYGLRVNTGGIVTLEDGSKLNSSTGNIYLRGGNMTLSTGSTLNSTASALEISPDGAAGGRLVLASGSTADFTSSNINIHKPGAVFVNATGTLNVNSGTTITTFSGGHVDVFSGGTLNNNPGGQVNVNFGVVMVHCGGIFNDLGTVTGTITYEICLPATLSIQPDSKDFGSVNVGSASFEATFTVTNVGGTLTTPLEVELSGPNSADYTINQDSCSETILALGGGNCAVSIMFNPSSEGARTASLDVSATGTSDSASLSGDGFVESTNSTPNLIVPGPQTGNELTTLSFAVSATDADSGQTLTLSAVSLPEGATFDAGTGQFSWIPSEIQGPGDYSATFKVVDDGSPILSDEKSVSIHINEVNSAPTIENPGTQSFEAGSPIAPIAFVVADSDLPPNTLSFSQTDLPSWASLDSTTGTITGTPAESDVGITSVTVTVTDSTLSDSTTFDLIVTAIPPPPNQLPIAESQSVITLQDTPKVITLIGSDPNNDSLSFSIVGESGPNYGTLSSLGPVIYYFEASLDGSQEVPAALTSGSGSGLFQFDESTNVLSFNIEFSNLDSNELDAHIHGPAPTGSEADVLFPLSIGSPKVGSVDVDDLTDPSGARSDLFAGLWYVNIHTTSYPGGEIRGQILPTGQASVDVTYTPNSGFTGLDGFEFEVNDGLATDTGIVQITVDAIPDTDGDGIADDIDQCPTDAETFNGFEDVDGCPDTPPVDGQIAIIGVPTFANDLSVEVSDADQNLNGQTPDVIPDALIIDVDRSGGDTEVFDLAETGDSTNTFHPDTLSGTVLVTFVNLPSDVIPDNGILELAPGDVGLDIVATYNDPLASSGVSQAFDAITQISKASVAISLPDSAGPDDTLQLLLDDMNLNDNSLVKDSYSFVFEGQGLYPLLRSGEPIDNIADFSASLNGAGLDFGAPLAYTVVENDINSGGFAVELDLQDMFASAGVVPEDGDQLTITYRNLMASATDPSSDTVAISVTPPPPTDSDDDGIPDTFDNCPSVANVDQADSDGDGIGNACDPFPNDPDNDSDGDGVSGHIDNCPSVSNTDQADVDGDGIGDVCDDDRDGDNVPNNEDVCPDLAGTEANGCPPVENTIANLISHIQSLNLAHGVETSLMGPIKNAQALIDDDNPANDVGVCGELDAFTNQVDAKEKNRQLASEEAAELRSRAGLIEESIGCQ